jgi:hypothetical protein
MLVPMIFMSDTTHLMICFGDKMAWPIFMTIRYLSAAAQIKYTMRSDLSVAIFPIAVKMCDNPLKRRNAQKVYNQMVF